MIDIFNANINKIVRLSIIGALILRSQKIKDIRFMVKTKRFHRHFETRGTSFYWVLFLYIVLGWFFPVVGLVALVCMVGPLVLAVRRGRYWCGHFCPRGNMYDRLLSRYSPHRPIPKFVRTRGFRVFMVVFIFSMFGVQLSYAESWSDVGRVFWSVIVVTTVVGVVLSFVFAPRTWCSFCPIGTLSRWLTPRRVSLPASFPAVHVAATCQMKCMSCARVCPMQLTPYDSRGAVEGFLDPDCIKCGKCTQACPPKIMKLTTTDKQ